MSRSAFLHSPLIDSSSDDVPTLIRASRRAKSRVVSSPCSRPHDQHGEETMLNVLLESKAPHTPRVGGTLASTLVHAAIITGAIALTVQPARSILREEP